MKRVTEYDFILWRGDVIKLQSYEATLSNSNIWLASTILQALDLLDNLKRKKPPRNEETGEEISNGIPPSTTDLQDIKEKLSELLDEVPAGRNRQEIQEEINNLLKDLNDYWENPDFDECFEQLPGDSKLPGGIAATGYKVDAELLLEWQIVVAQIRTNFQQYKQFNSADFISTLQEALDDFPGFIADQVEAFITNKFLERRGSVEGTVNQALEYVAQLFDRLNPEKFPECEDGTPEEDPPLKEPPITDTPRLEEPKPPTTTEPPIPTGDCCVDLVTAINRLGDNQIDYYRIQQNTKVMLKAMCEHLTNWIRETRIELKEARQDAKKLLKNSDRNYQWIRDTRTELKEARQDAKKILANQTIIIESLKQLELATRENKEQIVKTRKLIDWNSKMQAIGMAGLAALIGGIAAAIGAALAALTAEIAAAQAAIVAGLTTGFTTVGTALTTGFTKNQLEILRLRLQVGRGFNRIEDLINPYFTGSINSFDWVEMSDREKQQADREENSTLIDTRNFFVDTSGTMDDTKDVPSKYLKLEKREIGYNGYGLSAVMVLLEKVATVVNDVQGDLKSVSGGSYSTTTINVPVIAWNPPLYELDKDSNRDYTKLKTAADLENLYNPPDYSNSTPYIEIKAIQVPVGMEQTYLYQYNQGIDAFWQDYLNPPIILMPDGWEKRPMKYRPQLQFCYTPIDENGTYIKRTTSYTLNVQHYDYQRLGKPKECPLPDYQKGKIYALMELDDGSKNIVFGINKAEVLKVMQAIREITNPDYCQSVIVESLENNNLRWGEADSTATGKHQKDYTVSAVWCDYYSKGKPNRTYAIQRDWRVFFDRANF